VPATAAAVPTATRRHRGRNERRDDSDGSRRNGVASE